MNHEGSIEAKHHTIASAALLSPVEPLEEAIPHFWRMGQSPNEVVIDPHAGSPPDGRVLRDLGPSPFEGGRFPLVGFLATAFDIISRNAQERLAHWVAHHATTSSRTG